MQLHVSVLRKKKKKNEKRKENIDLPLKTLVNWSEPDGLNDMWLVLFLVTICFLEPETSSSSKTMDFFQVGPIYIQLFFFSLSVVVGISCSNFRDLINRKKKRNNLFFFPLPNELKQNVKQKTAKDLESINLYRLMLCNV